MMEVDIPEVLSELTAMFDVYEKALTGNDIETLNNLFWESASTVRYGTRELNASTDTRRLPRFEFSAAPSISPGL